MGENCDQWAAQGKRNLEGHIPNIIEMESETGKKTKWELQENETEQERQGNGKAILFCEKDCLLTAFFSNVLS